MTLRHGRYQLLGLLGRGGMGEVWRARHLDTGAEVALKRVGPVRAAQLQSVRREIRALRRLRHPGIVTIVDDGIDDGIPWMAMALVEGLPLGRALGATASVFLASTMEVERDVDEPPQSSVELPRVELAAGLAAVRRLCGALAYLHGEGLVHSDLKPDNVLVRPDGTPVLVDFGLVTGSDDLGRDTLDLHPAAGTPKYMSPEQIRGELLDARADLYSLGCMLYELVCGQTPFTGARLDVLHSHLREEPPPLGARADVPAELESLVHALLAKRARDRPGYADDVARWLGRLGVAGDAVGPAPRPYLYRPALAGRDAPLHTLDTAVVRLGTQAGGLWLVGGESGIGKTRLCHEVARRAAVDGVHVLVGETPPPWHEDAGTLAALRAPLRQLADLCRERGAGETGRIFGDRLPVLAELDASLADLPGGQERPPPLPAAAARLRLFAAIVDTLVACAAARPLLLILDDLQWADASTLDLLEHAFRHRRPRGLLVIGTYRTEEARALPARFAAIPELGHLVLSPLSDDAARALAADMLALHGELPPFVEELAREAEGNPFFAAEYLRLAMAEGRLARDDAGRWRVANDAALSLPGSLRDVVLRRMDGLDPEVHAVARAAAVLGREVHPPALAAMLGRGEQALEVMLDELLARDVLRDDGGALRFAHDKIRELIYEGLATEERRRLHRRAAETVAAGNDLILAHHLAGAGEDARAAACFLRAGDAALRRSAYEEARLAGAEAERLGAGVAGTLVVAEALLGLSRFDECLAEATRAAAAATGEAQARALWIQAELDDRRGRAAEALAALDALLAAPASETIVTRAIIARGGALWKLGRYDEAAVALRDGLARARAAGDEREEALALNSLGILDCDRGATGEGLAALGEALTIRRRLDDRFASAATLNSLGAIYLEIGRAAEAVAYLEESLATRRAIGDRRGVGMCLNNLGAVQAIRGAYVEAEKSLREALAIRTELDERWGRSNSLLDLARLYVMAGRPREAAPLLEDAVAAARAHEQRHLLAAALTLRARVGVDPLAARADASLAAELWRDLGNRAAGAAAAATAARLAAAEGDAASARARLAEAEAQLSEGDYASWLQAVEELAAARTALGEEDAAAAAAQGLEAHAAASGLGSARTAAARLRTLTR